MNNGIEILYTFTAATYGTSGAGGNTYEYYWDSWIEEGGLRNSETKRHTPIIRRFDGDQMYVGTREEVLEIIAAHKRANNIEE